MSAPRTTGSTRAPSTAPAAVAAGLSLAALALGSAHIALRQAVPSLVTYLLASASVAALVAGAAIGAALVRTLATVPAAAARGPLTRLPGIVVRVVLFVGAVLSAAGLAVGASRGVAIPSLLAGAAAVAGTLATLAVTASVATSAAIRPLLSPVDPDAPPPARTQRIARRLSWPILGVGVAAVAPGAALALGASASPAASLTALGALLGVAALTASAIGRATSDELASVAARLAMSGGPAQRAELADGAGASRPPGARISEVRGIEHAIVLLGDKIIQLRLTRALAVERALEADRLRTQFLANISHDLRSPLHAVLGFSDLLLRGVDGPLASQQQQSIERIRQNGTHLLQIIQEVLDLARVDAGKLELVRTPSIAAELLEQAVEEIRARFPLLTIEVSTRLERGLPTLAVDPYRLVQALTYLCTYAVEATTVGTQRKRVRLLVAGRVRGTAPRFDPGAPESAMRQFEIVVSAPDAEVPLEERRHLFDGFRGLTGRSGLGLGPHLARRFVELHGGTVLLTPGQQGLAFEVTLPA